MLDNKCASHLEGDQFNKAKFTKNKIYIYSKSLYINYVVET